MGDKMKYGIFFLGLSMAMMTSCSSEPMAIVCGKDFMKERAAVIDTASVFRSADPFVMQFRYGRSFDFSKLRWEVVSQSGKVIASKTSSVNEREGSFSVLVSSAKFGGLSSAAEFFRAKEGLFTLRFSNADADTLLLEKQVRVVRNSQMTGGAQ